MLEELSKKFELNKLYIGNACLTDSMNDFGIERGKEALMRGFVLQIDVGWHKSRFSNSNHSFGLVPC